MDYQCHSNDEYGTWVLHDFDGEFDLLSLLVSMKSNRKKFYDAKKKYTRCVVKQCKVKKINQDEKMSCVRKKCRKDDDDYSFAAFL